MHASAQDQYLEISTAVPADSALYGLQEHVPSSGIQLPRNGQIITLWNADHEAAQADVNNYGSHPFLLEVRAGKPESSFALHLRTAFS